MKNDKEILQEVFVKTNLKLNWMHKELVLEAMGLSREDERSRISHPPFSNEENELIFKKWASHKDTCEVRYEANGDCDCGWYEDMKTLSSPKIHITIAELKPLFEKYGLTRHFNLIYDIIDLQKPKTPENKNDKGEFGGQCNLSRCKTGIPATWYNYGSMKYYCKRCANELNADEYNKRDAIRLFGHDLCLEGKPKNK